MKVLIEFNLREVCKDLGFEINIALDQAECDRSVTCTIDEISPDGSEYEYDQPEEMAFSVMAETIKEFPIAFVLYCGNDLIKIKNAIEDYFTEWADNDLPHLVIDYAVDHRVSADEVRTDAAKDEVSGG